MVAVSLSVVKGGGAKALTGMLHIVLEHGSRVNVRRYGN
jgi:hypothetical protein